MIFSSVLCTQTNHGKYSRWFGMALLLDAACLSLGRRGQGCFHRARGYALAADLDYENGNSSKLPSHVSGLGWACAMARPKLPFQAKWEPEVKGYSVRTIRGWYGTLSRQYEFDDLMQEAYLVFLRCSDKLKVDNPRWFMALYKRSLHWRLCDLVSAMQPYSYLEEVSEVVELVAFDTSTEVFEVLESMPFELRLVAADLSRPVARLLKSQKDVVTFGSRLKHYLQQEIQNGCEARQRQGC